MKDKILQKLKDIEKEHDVTILYACESGSRAWGFASVDSDYDVRFIYVKNNTDWYISVERAYKPEDRPRDVIEVMDGDLDLSGWDIGKALWLMSKSNPPLLEWLNSPVKYLVNEKAYTILLETARKYFTRERCLKHYLHMGKNNFKEYLKNEEVRLKKYLYVVRPLLACKWIEDDLGQIPVEFDVLVEKYLSGRILEVVQDLLYRKKSGDELSKGPRIDELNDYLNESIEHMDLVADGMEGIEVNFADLNIAFKNILGLANETQQLDNEKEAEGGI